jgi:hypothetical protein
MPAERSRPALALVVLLLALLGSLTLARRADAYLYWANGQSGSIGRATDSGEDVNQSFISEIPDPAGLAVSGSYIYWAEPNSEGEHLGGIGRAHLDGSHVEPNFITQLNEPVGLAVSAGRIYWSEEATDTFGHANLDGSEADGEALPSWESPTMIAVSGNYLYFTTNYSSEHRQQVGRIDLEHGTIAPVYTEETSSLEEFGVAVSAGRLYWTGCTEGPSAIGSAALSGAGANYAFVPVPTGGCAVAVTADGGHLYWSDDYGFQGIGRSNLEGGQVEGEFISGAHEPVGLAVSEAPTLTGQASPGTALGGTLSDLATLEGGAEPTGTLTFNLYGPADPTCSAAPLFTANLPAGGDSTYPSPKFTPTLPGTYHWTVSYSGDAGNEPVADGCQGAGQSVAVTGTSPLAIVSSTAPTPVKQCTSQRLERIHWRLAPGVSVKSIHLTVNRKLYRTLPPSARQATVSFRGRRAGRVTVTISALTASRARYTATRVYHLCSPLHRERQVRSDLLR